MPGPRRDPTSGAGYVKTRSDLVDRWFKKRITVAPNSTLKYSTRDLHKDYLEYIEWLSQFDPRVSYLYFPDVQNFGMALHHRLPHRRKVKGHTEWVGIALRPIDEMYEGEE